MTGLRLITSAAFIGQELAIEFGQLPPAFLPLGVAPLYEPQIATFDDDKPIYLTIPEGFDPQVYDCNRLSELNVTIVRVPPNLSLGSSIIYALNYIDIPFDAVEILHGDTLIDDLNSATSDSIAIHSEGDDYSWAAVDFSAGVLTRLENIEAGVSQQSERPVACGYFNFGDGRLLVRCLTRASGDFIAGVNLYNLERPLGIKWAKTWRDFGHIQTYFRSRRSISTARSFNTLRIDPLAVRKSSADKNKIAAEAAWFQSVPPNIQPYCARLYEQGSDVEGFFYSTEYQYAPTLSELLVFSSIGRLTWRNILASCSSYLNSCAACTGTETSDRAIADLAIGKTVNRLERYARETGFSINSENKLSGRSLPSLVKIAENTAKLIDLNANRLETVMHGDFCFSNILYNSRSARISVIDPRGYIGSNEITCYGDLRYDLAKFSHSVIGCYDYIIAGRYKLGRESLHSFDIQIDVGANHSWLQGAISDIKVQNLSPTSLEIRAITVGLFLSMLPLHSDRPDRQAAFISIALRLYSEL